MAKKLIIFLNERFYDSDYISRMFPKNSLGNMGTEGHNLYNYLGTKNYDCLLSAKIYGCIFYK